MGLKTDHIVVYKKKNKILKGISVDLEVGVHGFLGPNGAGKTTFIRTLLGLYQPKEGSVTYKGQKFRPNSLTIGYLPQEFGLFPDMNIVAMLKYMAVIKGLKHVGQDEIEQCLEVVGLLEEKEKKVKELSGGMVRRLGIAQSLLGNPEILILDEPTAGLDPEERLRMKNLLYKIKGDRIILISTHVVEDLEGIADYISIMKSGTILFQDRKEKLLELAENKVYEVDQREYEKKQFKNSCIIKEYEYQGVPKYRVIIDEACEYKTLVPTIEDGYIYVQNIRG